MNISEETKDTEPFPGERNYPSSKTHHTGHGIASFVFGIGSITYLGFAYYFWQNLADSQMDPIPAVITMIFFSSPQLFVNLLGIYFAIEGKKRNDIIFAKLGIWVNGMVLSVPLIYILVIILVLVSVGT